MQDIPMNFQQIQQKMSDDIADIKSTIKETAQIMIFQRRDHDELKIKVDKIDHNQLTCPARLRTTSYGMTLKDIFYFITLFSAIMTSVANFYLLTKR
jgi:hypothetical protein